MRTEVMYRDLPGGPLWLDFTEQLPLSVFCSKCGMLSKSMFEDPSSHAFCSVCIFESSDRKKIHCKHESKEVSVDEMTPAFDIMAIVMDQLVYCPNKGGDNSCKKYCSLRELEGHYLECEQTKIFCPSCGGGVKGRDWEEHAKSCPQHILQCRYCLVAVPRCKLEVHERLCNENRWADRGSADEAMDPRGSETLPKTVAENIARCSDNQNKKKQIKAPANKVEATKNFYRLEIKSCEFCNCNVKERNMMRHVEICLKRKESPPTHSTLENGMETSEIMKTEPVSKEALFGTAPLAPHEGFQHLQQRSPSNTTGVLDGRQTQPTTEPFPTTAPAPTAPLASNEPVNIFTNALPTMWAFFSEEQTPSPSYETVHYQSPSSTEASGRNYGSQLKTDTSQRESDYEVIHSSEVEETPSLTQRILNGLHEVFCGLVPAFAIQRQIAGCPPEHDDTSGLRNEDDENLD